MLGTIVNSLTIIVGCLVGLLIKGKMSDKIGQNIMNGLALCVVYIGISGIIGGEDILITIISMAIGALIGEIIDFDKRLNKLGENIENKLLKNKSEKENQTSISQGFVSASLLFCVGAMSIVGSLQSGLSGDHQTLFAKSVIDGISAVIFTASLGIGVMLSSISVFVYQGSITLGASLLSGVLSDPVIAQMNVCGSLIIIGLGLNILKATNIKVANLVFAVFIPIFMGMFGII